MAATPQTENIDAHQATMKAKSKTRVLCLTLCVATLQVVLYSCIADTRHLVFATINRDGWAHTDTIAYTIIPLPGNSNTLGSDQKSSISLLLHTEAYKYSNIAIDIIIEQNNSLLYHELRSYQLDSCHPKNGIGHRHDYILPIGNITLCDTLPFDIILTQQLDQPLLVGIREVGVRIGTPMCEPGEPIWKANW